MRRKKELSRGVWEERRRAGETDRGRQRQREKGIKPASSNNDMIYIKTEATLFPLNCVVQLCRLQGFGVSLILAKAEPTFKKRELALRLI